MAFTISSMIWATMISSIQAQSSITSSSSLRKTKPRKSWWCSHRLSTASCSVTRSAITASWCGSGKSWEWMSSFTKTNKALSGFTSVIIFGLGRETIGPKITMRCFHSLYWKKCVRKKNRKLWLKLKRTKVISMTSQSWFSSKKSPSSSKLYKLKSRQSKRLVCCWMRFIRSHRTLWKG